MYRLTIKLTKIHSIIGSSLNQLGAESSRQIEFSVKLALSLSVCVSPGGSRDHPECGGVGGGIRFYLQHDSPSIN